MPKSIALDLKKALTMEQTSAFVMTLFPPASRLIASGCSFLDHLPADLSLSASVLVTACLCDTLPEERKKAALVITIAGVLLLALSLLFPGIPLPLICGLTFVLSVLGPCLLPIYSAGKKLSDKDYLISTYSGWEVLLLTMKHNLLLVFTVLSAMAALTCLLPQRGGLAARLASSSFLLAYEVLVTLRYIMSVPLLSGKREAFPDEDDFIPTPPSKIPVNYRGIYARICRHMEVEKPYLKEGLTIDDMCRELYTNKIYLSKVIHACTSYNFSQFMNLYRVRYAMKLYRSEPSLKMTDLAVLSGFGNSVSFNMAFRLFVDMTPGDWARLCRSEMGAASLKGRKGPSSPAEQAR